MGPSRPPSAPERPKTRRGAEPGTERWGMKASSWSRSGLSPRGAVPSSRAALRGGRGRGLGRGPLQPRRGGVSEGTAARVELSAGRVPCSVIALRENRARRTSFERVHLREAKIHC